MKVTYMEIATASGKRGGVVGGQWKGIQWLRKRVVPANPRSDGQMAQRAQLAGAVSAVVTEFATTPATRDAWLSWAPSNPYRSKNGMGTQILPGYQAAVTSVLNRLVYGNAADVDVLPSTTATPFPEGIVTLDWIAGGPPPVMGITYGAGQFLTTDEFWYWIELGKASRSPNFNRARHSSAATILGVPAGVTDAAITGDLVSANQYNFWVQRFKPTDKEPTPPIFLGSFVAP